MRGRAAACRVGPHKLVEFFDTGQLELYDLLDDPLEAVNIAGDHPEIVASIREEMRAWRTKVGARLPATPAEPVQSAPPADVVPEVSP